MKLNIEYICGYCPVQAEGTINGEPFYFRARCDKWSIGIGGDCVLDGNWVYQENYGEVGGFEAGWMTTNEAEELIKYAVNMWLEQHDRD